MPLRNNYLHYILALILILSTSCTKGLTVYDLSCEHLNDPLAISTSQPRFSWKNKSNIQGMHQSAYQILVATDIDKLNENEADGWNSGKVESSSNVLVEYKGNSLESGQLMYWKVRTWDDQGNLSSWSSPARFGIGLNHKNDWLASYITLPLEQGFSSSPQLRKTFVIDHIENKTVYLLHVNSLGYHEVFVNGKKVNDDILSPSVSQFNKRSLINTYDLTEILKNGENDLIIWLGSGWYSEGLPGVMGDGPAVRAQLEHVKGFSKETLLVTNESWTGRNSEYSRISNWRSGRYGGEVIIGNIENRNKVFETPNSLSWEKVVIAEVPDHETSPQMAEPNRITETIHPINIEKRDDGTLLVDMGKCISGWFEVIFTDLDPLQEIVMEYSDHLNEKGEIANQGQVDRYIASGEGSEVFKNKFNYHGFQYVKISNLKQAPKLEEMKAHLIHTNFKTASSFESSDQDLNDIHDMIVYTLKNVGLGGYLVDCPQIERLGYGGDGNASTISAQTMFNMAPLYSNWLQAWEDVIREDGSMPHTAPNPYAAGGGPYWCGFIISATWNTYQHYGDKRLIEKYYPTMQKWLEYVDIHMVDGLLKRWPDTDYRAWYLGDWATPDGVGNPNHLDEKSVDLVNNCYISICFNQMKKMAKVLGKQDDAAYYLDRRVNLNEIIHETFYDESEGVYSTGSQIDLIFPMLANVVPTDLEEQLTRNLFERTQTFDKGHLNTGLVGIPVMMEWAATVREPDYIYSMLKKRSYPGYLYMLDQGATTTWEHWNGERSRIHNCYNGVGQWFYQVVGGIRSVEEEPGYRRFFVDPQIPAGVSWAKTSKETPYGIISVNWELHDDRLSLGVQVPFGTTAELVIPESAMSININREQIDVLNENVYLPSGNHVVEYFF